MPAVHSLVSLYHCTVGVGSPSALTFCSTTLAENGDPGITVIMGECMGQYHWIIGKNQFCLEFYNIQ